MPLWRYMDFWKFLNLINSSQLYFPNVEQLGDQHEGKIPERIFDAMKSLDRNLGRVDFAEKYVEGLNRARKEILVSSWSAGFSENFAMWKMYAKEKLGVAIKTDIEGLKNAFNEAKENIYIGEVEYYDNNNPGYMTGNIYYSFLVKHNYYNFENEVRCIHCLNTEEKKIISSKNIKVDLNLLIKELYISRFAKDIGIEDLINKMKNEKNLKFEI